MTEPLWWTTDPAAAHAAAKVGVVYGGTQEHLSTQIGEQVKPAIEEPAEFGSVVRATYSKTAVLRFCRTYSVDVDEPWCSGNHMRSWADVIEGASAVEVLRVGIGPGSCGCGEQDCNSCYPLAEWESDLLNQQARRDAATAVLSAMDVDQYLIDAVANARPR